MTTTERMEALEEQIGVLIANALRLRGERDALQARLDEAERLLTELTRDGFTLREEFWGAVKDARAFLKGGTNG